MEDTIFYWDNDTHTLFAYQFEFDKKTGRHTLYSAPHIIDGKLYFEKVIYYTQKEFETLDRCSK